MGQLIRNNNSRYVCLCSRVMHEWEERHNLAALLKVISQLSKSPSSWLAFLSSTGSSLFHILTFTCTNVCHLLVFVKQWWELCAEVSLWALTDTQGQSQMIRGWGPRLTPLDNWRVSEKLYLWQIIESSTFVCKQGIIIIMLWVLQNKTVQLVKAE